MSFAGTPFKKGGGRVRGRVRIQLHGIFTVAVGSNRIGFVILLSTYDRSRASYRNS